MGRPSTKIKALTTKDKQLLKMLNKTNKCTLAQAKQLNNISKERINKLCKSGYAELKATRYGTILQATEKGNKIVNNGTGTYHGAGERHDLTLTQEYLKLTQEERDHITTGDHFARSRGLTVKGTPDLVIEQTTETEVIRFIEIITDNYGREQIEEKEEFAEICKAEIKIIHSDDLGEE